MVLDRIRANHGRMRKNGSPVMLDCDHSRSSLGSESASGDQEAAVGSRLDLAFQGETQQSRFARVVDPVGLRGELVDDGGVACVMALLNALQIAVLAAASKFGDAAAAISPPGRAEAPETAPRMANPRPRGSVAEGDRDRPEGRPGHVQHRQRRRLRSRGRRACRRTTRLQSVAGRDVPPRRWERRTAVASRRCMG